MILCLSHSRDYYTIDIVRNRLKELKQDSFRLDSDHFGHQARFAYQDCSGPFALSLDIDGRRFSTGDVAAVWYRKLWHPEMPATLDQAYHAIYYQEYHTMRDIFFEALAPLPWMNPLPQDHALAANKLRQLELARRHGLDIVPTLMTNDPGAVRKFFTEECQGAMIAKLHGTLSRSMEGGTPFLPTTRITEKDLDHLDSLPYCPMIFQQLVPCDYELRVAYVDGQCFAGKIDTRASQKSRTDWRFATDLAVTWEPYRLPDPLVASLTAMMKACGLLFGAIDLMRHRDGRYIFLEVNPQGEWGMLQRDLGYRIGETIAERLAAAC